MTVDISKIVKDLDKLTKDANSKVYKGVASVNDKYANNVSSSFDSSKDRALDFYSRFAYHGALGGAFHAAIKRGGYSKKLGKDIYVLGVAMDNQQAAILNGNNSKAYKKHGNGGLSGANNGSSNVNFRKIQSAYRRDITKAVKSAIDSVGE